MKKPRLPRTPKTTHGAKHRSAPTGTHLSKKTLKRSDSEPPSSHKNKKTLSRPDSAPKNTHSARNPINNLGDYAYRAKLPSGKKIGVKAVKRVAKSITSTTKGIQL